MTNDVEIGTLGEHRVYMSFKEIKKIANKELSKRLKKATEALRFYADADMYEHYDKYNSTAVQHDGGQKAREALKEIEE